MLFPFALVQLWVQLETSWEQEKVCCLDPPDFELLVATNKLLLFWFFNDTIIQMKHQFTESVVP